MGEAAKDETPKSMRDNIALLLFFVGWYVGNIYYNQYNKMALDGALPHPSTAPPLCERRRPRPTAPPSHDATRLLTIADASTQPPAASTVA